jgi:PTS system fructose-specific IIB component
MSVSAENRILIVAVTACPTGVAHSQMAAEALSQAADDAGYDISIEVQGAMGTEGELTQEDLRAADTAVVAADVTVGTERFDHLPVVNVPVSEAVTEADALLTRAAELAERSDSGDGGAQTTGTDPDHVTTGDGDSSGDRDGLFTRLRRRFL